MPNDPEPSSALPAKIASELNNLLQIISGTSTLIENIWEGTEGSQRYFSMLRASIERAEQVMAQMVAQAGGVRGKMVLNPALQQPTGTVSLPSEKSGRSVLLADDEPMALTLLQRVLSEAGYEVVLAQSGFECLDIFRRHPHVFDLVLLDFTMPFMDGEETFHRLRRISPVIDVVLMAGFVDRECLARMLNAGLAGFLSKPFSPGEVLSLADSVCERARQWRMK